MFRLFARTLDIARTIVHYLMYAILGLMMSIPGPTLLDLKQLSGTDSYGISFIFTARSTGYLIGSVTGGIILDCMKNEDIALMVSSLFVAIGAFTIPWCRNLTILLATFMITGFAMGFSNTGSNGSLLRIWGKKGAPFLQGLHFTYGIGGFFAPLLAAPFLSAHVPTIPRDLTLLGVTQNLTTEVIAAAVNFTEEKMVTVNETSIPSITYAYTIVGVLATLVCGCFVLVFSLASNEKSNTEEDKQENIRDPGLPFTIVVVILACLQTGLISGVEVSFAQMLTSYVVHSEHGLTKVVGSYMTSVYWGAFTLTRGLSIFLACKISVRKILAFDLLLSVASALVLLTIGTWSVTGLWVGTAMLGVGVASIFPATLSWVEKYININNRIASVFTLVSSILEMTVPLSISIYLGTQPNVLFHFMTSATISAMVLFIILNVILKRKGKKYIAPAVEKSDEKLKSGEV
ncbi:sodium-dependent glucose transporter 1A-like isoform X1 [Argiope bruennichi]|uniref:Sodium-dependent glucose transporter 1 like protein n=2 Tax=Argiope bruennichi TaxID=94029 RepID=A0A8T0F6T0_ARGBR|nr:sodium-dependent glucose transporter 1A-like isoform X1 [Argiope bruennichi]XP_055926601.1 sodium-dependent glucose transporter 1A-like isoform X1 [Argiope bruennichi]XP_055926602.1 sodium-dependent glucose transporter 1A-like isoform X1 [Argiope bruennichi]KAF8785945.1 Sodium-dependent glucose transporter 1 like protein [Argiope bruennichi]